MIACVTLAASLLLQSPTTLAFDKVQAQRIKPDGKAEMVDIKLSFEATEVSATEKKKNGERRALPYTAIQTGEYSYTKSPRVSAALLVSPLFLFNSSKSHWLTLKGPDGYIVLRLDKSHFRTVIAEVEHRAKIKVVTLEGEK